MYLPLHKKEEDGICRKQKPKAALLLLCIILFLASCTPNGDQGSSVLENASEDRVDTRTARQDIEDSEPEPDGHVDEASTEEPQIVVPGEGLYEVFEDSQGNEHLRLLYTTTHDINEVISAPRGDMDYAYVKVEEDTLDVQIQYPHFTGMADDEVEEYINELLRSISHRIYDQLLESNDDAFRRSYVRVDIEVKFFNSEMISLFVKDVTGHYGGKVEARIYGLNFNPNDGSLYRIQSFYYVTEEFVNVLAQSYGDFTGLERWYLEIAQGLIHGDTFRLSEYDGYWGSWPCAYYLSDRMGFYFEDHRLGLYGPYEIPYTALHEFTTMPDE